MMPDALESQIAFLQLTPPYFGNSYIEKPRTWRREGGIRGYDTHLVWSPRAFLQLTPLIFGNSFIRGPANWNRKCGIRRFFYPKYKGGRVRFYSQSRLSLGVLFRRIHDLQGESGVSRILYATCIVAQSLFLYLAQLIFGNSFIKEPSTWQRQVGARLILYPKCKKDRAFYS